MILPIKSTLVDRKIAGGWRVVNMRRVRVQNMHQRPLALAKERVAGAALDVVEHEPLPSESPASLPLGGGVKTLHAAEARTAETFAIENAMTARDIFMGC